MDRGAWWATVHGLEKSIIPPHPLSLHPSQPPPIDFEFPRGLNGKESVCSAGDPGLIPGSGRCPGEGSGNPLQYSCLENPMDKQNLVGYSPWGHKESDTTEWLSTAQQVPYLLYPFICWWTSRLLPCAGHYKQCYNEHWNCGFLRVCA